MHYYVIISFILLLIFIYSKKRIWTLILVILTTLHLYEVVPYFIRLDEKNINYENKLKIYLSNVLTKNTKYNLTLNLITKEAPDIIVLQEVDPKWAGFLKSNLNSYPYYEIIPRIDNFGICIFSKYELKNIKRKYLKTNSVPSIIADISFENKSITMIAAHPLPPANLKLMEMNKNQIIELCGLVKKSKANTILLGDLNVTNWSYKFKKLINAGLHDTRKGIGILATWPVNFFIKIPIDHCLIKGDIKLLDLKMGPDIGSDHYPLICEFGF
jgi:endonuclease/exonuclease/phosphatase (EEP) superfamily protein YafD